uniref:Uncharacterized protein n=1 Tax=Panagrolaimus davidi TaxID=227884 RepID=A0A914QWJ1_9BILA
MSHNYVIFCLKKYNSDESCLWNLIHIKFGAQVLCAFGLIGYILSVTAVIERFKAEGGTFWEVFEIIEIILGIVGFIGVLVGIKQSKPQYFYLCLVLFVFQMFIFSGGMFFFLSFYAFVMDAGEEHFTLDKTNGKGVSISDILRIVHVILACIVGLIYDVFAFDVLYKCYRFITEKNAADNDAFLGIPRSINSPFHV